jgi:hypothetical protein
MMYCRRVPEEFYQTHKKHLRNLYATDRSLCEESLAYFQKLFLKSSKLGDEPMNKGIKVFLCVFFIAYRLYRI